MFHVCQLVDKNTGIILMYKEFPKRETLEIIIEKWKSTMGTSNYCYFIDNVEV